MMAILIFCSISKLSYVCTPQIYYNMKKTLLILLFLTISYNGFTQSIGIIGDFSGWVEDIDFTDNGNGTYTLSNYYIHAGDIKFREDDAWTFNWGTDPNNLEFPMGTLIEDVDGAANIPVNASGFYDVFLDFNNNFYSFTVVTGTNQNLGIVGDFNMWDNDVVMTTTDFINYLAEDVVITDGFVKIRRNGNWDVNYGGMETEGVSVVNGDDIAITSGIYNVSFNIETLEYSFVASTLSDNEFSENDINAFVVNNTLRIEGYNGNAIIKVYSILGQLMNSKTINVKGTFIRGLELPSQQLSLVVVEGDTFKKTIKVIAK